MASSRQPADSHDLSVQGARENNLKNISVELPKHRLTVFTGVSGSVKSSLVFGTIAAASQRLINETYSAFLQGFMPTPGRPDVDVLEGLTTAIIVDQERMGANARSTVGHRHGCQRRLRVLWSRLGKPRIGPATVFSFNVPMRKASGAMNVDKGRGERIVVRDVVYFGGMCPKCEGLGQISLAAVLPALGALPSSGSRKPATEAGSASKRATSASVPRCRLHVRPISALSSADTWVWRGDTTWRCVRRQRSR